MDQTTIVVDVGARYGIHPSWSGFDAPLRYYAFEPDSEEAERLQRSHVRTDHIEYVVLPTALDSFEGERDFHLLKHRALSSCLKPDLESECFRHLKPGQAEVERILKVRVRRLDDVFSELHVAPDFLKIDTEGTEHDVMEGAEHSIMTSVLGVRSSCNFQRCFHGQKLFSESHDYLLTRDFVLLNIDYKGFGYPRLGLFRKPDPTEGEDFRYGFLVAADAVWIRRIESLDQVFTGDNRGLARLKLAFFCMLNNAPDVGLDIARESRDRAMISRALEATRLYAAFRLRAARFLGRWRTVPDEQWEKARQVYADIFGEELAGGSDFYPQVQRMVAALTTGS